MLKLNQQSSRVSPKWAWLLPVLALAPLALAGSACSNSGVVGDDCPTMDCATAGSSGSGGTGAGTGTVPAGKNCGGLLPASCAKGLYCDYPPSAACGAGDQTGVCVAEPGLCTEIYAPVCGCDNKTYSSDCVAHAAGVSVASTGECASGGGGTGSGGASGTTCGGLLGTDCPGGQFCNFPVAATCGSGDQTGTCQAKPDACDAVYAPVCGCNDKTYGNDCEAASAGISVAKAGECAGNGGATCGGRGNGTCGANQYCNYPPSAMCGRADATGTCAAILEGGCLANFDPVCGCDGMTYGNACEAGRVGAAIDHTGECKSTGTTCGGFMCDEPAEFCDYPATAACGAADASGTCKAVPEICPAIADPVCGCDGKPYGSPCQANAAGTSVLNKGACK